MTISGADAGKSYTVRVKANNAGGASAWTSLATTPAAPPDVAASTISVTHNGASLSVSWTPPARAPTYDVTYQTTLNGTDTDARPRGTGPAPA